MYTSSPTSAPTNALSLAFACSRGNDRRAAMAANTATSIPLAYPS